MKNEFPPLDQHPNFDDLSMLAATDLAGFEKLRSALIEHTINSGCENSAQLTRLQARLDSVAHTGEPPYFKCLHLSEWLDEPYQKLARQLSAAQAPCPMAAQNSSRQPD